MIDPERFPSETVLDVIEQQADHFDVPDPRVTSGVKDDGEPFMRYRVAWEVPGDSVHETCGFVMHITLDEDHLDPVMAERKAREGVRTGLEGLFEKEFFPYENPHDLTA